VGGIGWGREGGNVITSPFSLIFSSSWICPSISKHPLAHTNPTQLPKSEEASLHCTARTISPAVFCLW